MSPTFGSELLSKRFESYAFDMSSEQIKFDEEWDVVVAGSGAAGCAAAASAAHHGARRVLVAEKSRKLVGGTTRLAGGGWLWCPGNPFLKDLGFKYDPEEIVELLEDLSSDGGKIDLDPNDVALMRTFAYDWPPIVEEILKAGVMDLRPVDTREDEDTERMKSLLRRKAAAFPGGVAAFEAKTGIKEGTANFDKLAALMPSYCAEHDLDNCPSGKVLAPDGSTTSLQLEKAVKKLYKEQCEMRMGCAIVELLYDAGRVVGCVVEETSGDKKSPVVVRKNVKTKLGVVFGSGGFSHNAELMHKHYGANGVPYGTCSSNTNTGDFVRMCHEAPTKGGPVVPCEGMDLAWIKQTVLPYKFPARLGVFFLNGDSFIVVDKFGKRFACEKDFYQQRASQMKESPDRRIVFFVYDERAGEKFDGPIKGLGGPIPRSGGGKDCTATGSTTAELRDNIAALLAKVEPSFTLDADFADTLDAQLDRYNEMAASDGVDYEFQRGQNAAQYCWAVPRAKDNDLPNKTMYPLEKTKLKCVMMGLSTLDTKGGPRVDGEARVLDISRKPVPGLYGAGNAVKSSTNNSYPASGVTLSNAVLFGWKAGRAAVMDSKKSAL